jgi:hypothetical protein
LRVRANNTVVRKKAPESTPQPTKGNKIKTFYTLLAKGGYIGEIVDKKVIKREWREKP